MNVKYEIELAFYISSLNPGFRPKIRFIRKN